MAKTVFNDGNASLGVLGTRVLAAWLNAVFSHRHTGQDDDGHAPQIAYEELEEPVQELLDKSLAHRHTGAAEQAAKIELAELADVVLKRLVPAGTIIHTASNVAPDGYFKANGAAVSRVNYPELFAAIGTIYGAGDGATTFNLPDLRGEFIRGFDDGRGIDAGRAFGSAQADAFKSHRHDMVYDRFGEASGGTSNDAGLLSGSADTLLQASYVNPDIIVNTGGAETRPRNVALLACIKY